MKLLVVEDDATLAAQLRTRLVAAGYAVDVAQDGREGLYFGCEYDYDAAVIDLGLPHIDGVQLIVQLRARQRLVPVLILTARDAWQDKVAGLNAGADDYVTKPFRMEEVLARLQALLRRAAGHASPLLEMGGIVLDSVRQQVLVGDTTVELTAFEFKVLHYLMLHRDHVVSKAELTEHNYEQDFDRDSNTIEVFVGRLRRKLREAGASGGIDTLRGRGYRLGVSSG